MTDSKMQDSDDDRFWRSVTDDMTVLFNAMNREDVVLSKLAEVNSIAGLKEKLRTFEAFDSIDVLEDIKSPFPQEQEIDDTIRRIREEDFFRLFHARIPHQAANIHVNSGKSSGIIGDIFAALLRDDVPPEKLSAIRTPEDLYNLILGEIAWGAMELFDNNADAIYGMREGRFLGEVKKACEDLKIPVPVTPNLDRLLIQQEGPSVDHPKTRYSESF